MKYSLKDVCSIKYICILIIKQIMLCFDFIFWSVVFLRSMLWLIENKIEFHYIKKYFFMVVGIVAIITFGYKIFEIYIEPKIKLQVYENASKLLFDKVISSKMEYLEQRNSNNKFMEITKLSVTHIFEYMERFAVLIGRILTCFLVTLILGYIDYKAIFILIIPIVGNIFVQKKYYDLKFISECKHESYNVQKEYVKRCFYSKEYAGEIRMSNVYEVLLQIYDKAINKAIQVHKEFGSKKVLLSFATELLKNRIPFSLIFIYAVYCAMINKSVSVFDISVILVGLVNLSDQIGILINAISDVTESRKHINVLLEFLNEDIEEKSDSMRTQAIYHDSIRVENLSFAYPDEDPILQNISFEIKKGEKVAIVGENGSGKSTLLKLLIKLYTPTGGKIYLDNVDIESIDTENYRAMFSVVQQDSKLFAFSVNENISCGVPYKRKKLWYLWKSLGLTETIKMEDDGLEVSVSNEFDEGGKNFSGGEERKILLARALVKDALIGVFDEPMAALDPFAEERLMNLLFESYRFKTSIFVLHQLAYAKKADKIIVLDKGRMIECGNFTELMRLKGKYYQMYKMQEKKFVDNTSVDIKKDSELLM